MHMSKHEVTMTTLGELGRHQVTMTTEVSPGYLVTSEVEIFTYDECIAFMDGIYRRHLAHKFVHEESWE
jgi:hypothetical protein